MCDFKFIVCGSVTTVRSVSEAAQELAEEMFIVDDWQGSPVRFSTDTRVASQLAEQLAGDGYEVEVC